MRPGKGVVDVEEKGTGEVGWTYITKVTVSKLASCPM